MTQAVAAATTTKLPVIRLKPRCDRRLRQGHCWIYSNEIDNHQDSYAQLAPGDCATVVNANNEPMGSAYFNSSILLCGRLYSRQANCVFDGALIQRRLADALQWRETRFDQPYYRWVYGDGDRLPGVVIDRFGEFVVLQLTTVAAMARLDEIVAAVKSLVRPQGILLRNEGGNSLEKLPEQTEVVYGEIPQRVALIENGVRFSLSLHVGQKTGWFYDHRDSRAMLATLAKGKRVLDVFSYLGGWGIQALQGGASQLYCVDSSKVALEQAEATAEALGYASAFTAIPATAVDAMKQLIRQRQTFDIVILDPPAFIKRRKDQRQGEKAYHHINQLAVKLVAEQGLLVSASCSLHLLRSTLNEVVQVAANKSRRSAMVIYQGGLGADHPVNAAMPEMDYLKTVFARIV